MRWYSIREDLGIDYYGTCVGYDRSEGRRCRSPTSLFMQDRASISLDIMLEDGIDWEQLTHDHPDEDYIDECLEQLACYILCPQHFRDQKCSLISDWKRRILARERERILQEVRALETTVETITTMIESVSLANQQPILEDV